MPYGAGPGRGQCRARRVRRYGCRHPVCGGLSGGHDPARGGARLVDLFLRQRNRPGHVAPGELRADGPGLRRLLRSEFPRPLVGREIGEFLGLIAALGIDDEGQRAAGSGLGIGAHEGGNGCHPVFVDGRGARRRVDDLAVVLPARLQELIRLTQGEKPADPGLAEALEAIALRARLELARRGMEA